MIAFCGGRTFSGANPSIASFTSAISASIGAFTSRSYTALRAPNHSRSLFRFNPRRNFSVSFEKCVAIYQSYLPHPDTHCHACPHKTHRVFVTKPATSIGTDSSTAVRCAKIASSAEKSRLMSQRVFEMPARLTAQSLEPRILAQCSTAEGVAMQLRSDPAGVLRVPELTSVLVAVHVGPAAKISCRRAGTSHTGSAVHGDIDIIPAGT